MFYDVLMPFAERQKIDMKKISFVIGSLTGGGAERVISILSNKFAEKGYDVSIIQFFYDKVDYEISDKVHIYTIHSEQKKVFLRYPHKIILLRRLLKKLDSDCVISFLWDINLCTILSKLFIRGKLIISERNDPHVDPKNKILQSLKNVMYLCADNIVFQTHDALEFFPRPIKKRGVIIGNPINTNMPYWDLDQSKKRIIAVNRITKQKNLPMLIKAFDLVKDKFPDYKLHIYGRGEAENEIQQLIAQLNLNSRVELKGFSNNIYEEIKKSRLYVISSDYEGLSNSMLEALAIGIPVIATDCPIGGAKEYITDGVNGMLVNCGDIQVLSKKIELLLMNDEMSKKFSTESIKIRKQLNPDRIVNIWEQLIL